MKFEIKEEQIISAVETILLSVVEDVITNTDMLENIVIQTIEPRVKKIVESGKIDRTLEDEAKRFIENEWDSSDINGILINRISDKLVLKSD